MLEKRQDCHHPTQPKFVRIERSVRLKTWGPNQMIAKRCSPSKFQWMDLENHWRKNFKLSTAHDAETLCHTFCCSMQAPYLLITFINVKQEFAEIKWGTVLSWSKILYSILASPAPKHLQWIGQNRYQNTNKNQRYSTESKTNFLKTVGQKASTFISMKCNAASYQARTT